MPPRASVLWAAPFQPRYRSPRQGGGATAAGVPRHTDAPPRASGLIAHRCWDLGRAASGVDVVLVRPGPGRPGEAHRVDAQPDGADVEEHGDHGGRGAGDDEAQQRDGHRDRDPPVDRLPAALPFLVGIGRTAVAGIGSGDQAEHGSSGQPSSVRARCQARMRGYAYVRHADVSAANSPTRMPSTTEPAAVAGPALASARTRSRITARDASSRPTAASRARTASLAGAGPWTARKSSMRSKAEARSGVTASMELRSHRAGGV